MYMRLNPTGALVFDNKASSILRMRDLRFFLGLLRRERDRLRFLDLGFLCLTLRLRCQRGYFCANETIYFTKDAGICC